MSPVVAIPNSRPYIFNLTKGTRERLATLLRSIPRARAPRMDVRVLLAMTKRGLSTH